jgi:hypothetical protein
MEDLSVWAARGLCTPRIASAVAMAGPTVPFSSSLRRLLLSSTSEAHPVTYGRARREIVVSRSPCRKQHEHERTRAGKHAAQVQGGAHTVGALSETTLPVQATRPGVNREPSGRSRGRVSQAFALTTASECRMQARRTAPLACAFSGSDQKVQLSINDVPNVRSAGYGVPIRGVRALPGARLGSEAERARPPVECGGALALVGPERRGDGCRRA